MKHTLSFTGLLAFVLWLSASNSGFGTATTEIQFKTLESDRLSMELPATLSETVEDFDSTALLDYEDLDNGVFCLAFEELKADWLEVGDSSDLTGRFREVAERFQEGFNGSTLSQVTDEPIGSFPAKLGTVTGDLEEGGIFMRIGTLETPEAFVTIVIWCEQSERKRYESAFDRCLRSFKLKG